MPNKCVVVGCNTGHKKGKRKYQQENADDGVHSSKKSMFHFPQNDEELKRKWIKFVSRKEWTPSDSSVVCSDHFDSKYLICGDKRTHLDRELLDPVPTIYPDGYIPVSSMLPSSSCCITQGTHRS